MTSIPNDTRVPLAFIAIDNSLAVTGTPVQQHQILVLGHGLDGTAVDYRPERVTNDSQIASLFGKGSMLTAMCLALRKANTTTSTWVMQVPAPTEGAAATAQLTLGGTATESGTLALMIAGQAVQVRVSQGDTGAIVAVNTLARINAAPLPLLASAIAAQPGELLLTCKWKGLSGNDVDVRANHYTGERLPAGLTFSATTFSGGRGSVDMAAVISAMPQEWFNHIVMPFNDAQSMATLKQEMARRWGPLVMQDGQVYCAFRGTHAQTATHTRNVNSQIFTIMGTNKAPDAPWTWAATYAGTAARELAIDPARPLQTLMLKGLNAPSKADVWDVTERNLLLWDGCATYTVTAGGEVAIEREISTYRVNAYGDNDPSYLDITTTATLSYLRYSMRSRITQRYPRHKLADDSVLGQLAPGQPVATPKLIKACLLELALEWVSAGLLEDFETFKASLSVVRNKSDKNRVDVLCHPDVVNQLRCYAALMQFKL